MSAPEIGTHGAVYGESKRCAEMLVHLLGSEHADVTIARLFSFFGPLICRFIGSQCYSAADSYFYHIVLGSGVLIFGEYS